MKFPLVLRSILLGFIVSTSGVLSWVLLAKYLPVPWSVVAMGGILILFWMYYRGRWNPAKTKAFRRYCTRQIKLKRPVWTWGLIASFFLFLFVSSGMVFTFRMVEFEAEQFKTASYLNDVPAWAAWSVLLMASLVAGVCEETGFRGYMQTPLENKLGPVAGISITSLVFVVVHLHQAWASGILVQIFVISFMIGYLAYATRSLIPGMIAHVSFDVVNFSYWWSDVAGNFHRKPVSMTGVDTHFILSLMVVLLSLFLFFVAIRKLIKLKGALDLT